MSKIMAGSKVLPELSPLVRLYPDQLKKYSDNILYYNNIKSHGLGQVHSQKYYPFCYPSDKKGLPSVRVQAWKMI